MHFIKNFLLFWYDFIVGDDWMIAASVVLALLGTALLARREVQAWWLAPAAVAVMLTLSIWRETRKIQ